MLFELRNEESLTESSKTYLAPFVGLASLLTAAGDRSTSPTTKDVA